MEQGFACTPGGLCVYGLSWPVSYDKALPWKVLDNDSSRHCIRFMFVNWSSGPSFRRCRSLQERSHALDYTLWGVKCFWFIVWKKKTVFVLSKEECKVVEESK